MSHVAWLVQAESDLKAAAKLSADNHHAQAVWLAAQAVEKAHKAILAALGLRYEDRHYRHLGHNTGEISRLLPEGLHEPADPQIAQMVAALERRASDSRYPAPSQGPNIGLAGVVAPATWMVGSAVDVENAERLVAWCRERVARAERAAVAMRPSGT